jgi:WhiB family redox-sensing transcriptional regulator
MTIASPIAERPHAQSRAKRRTMAPASAFAPLPRGADAWAWQLSARCRTEDPSVFFHPDGERGKARSQRQRKAKAICADCPVIVQCRKHSLTFGERFGTWGGLSEDDRSRPL